MSFSISVSANPFLTRLHFIFGAPISPCNCQLCRYIYINTGLGRFVFVSCFIVYKTMSENWHNTAPHTEITFDGKQYSIYARLCWAKNNLFFFLYLLFDRPKSRNINFKLNGVFRLYLFIYFFGYLIRFVDSERTMLTRIRVDVTTTKWKIEKYRSTSFINNRKYVSFRTCEQVADANTNIPNSFRQSNETRERDGK